eukprot:SM000081S22627  [mRNA]  locus=s81:231057:237143:+ [translate_table: standard]
MYDEGNRLLLVSLQSKIYSWPVNQDPALSPLPAVCPIAEGPVLAVRFSLDRSILAVQRSAVEVEFVNRASCTTFRQRCRHGARILGFFWSDSPICDLVFVTSNGLELYALLLSKAGLRLVDHKKGDVAWFVYTHESRLVLLATGPLCRTLSAYQFAAGGHTKVPKFEAKVTKSHTAIAATLGGASPRLALASEDVRITTMYGRLYCLQVDRQALQLHIFRFYRDAVVHQGTVVLYSPHVAVSVVDNVLLLHQTDSGVVLLYDLFAVADVQPLTSPLPLTLRPTATFQQPAPPRPAVLGSGAGDGLGPAAAADTRSGRAHENGAERGPAVGEHGDANSRCDSDSAPFGNGGGSVSYDADSSALSDEECSSDCGTAHRRRWAAREEQHSGDGDSANSTNGTARSGQLYSGGWVFLNPDLILDHRKGLLWRLHLDLRAIAASCSNQSTLLGFLQRRRADVVAAKELSIVVLRSMVAERTPLPAVSAAMTVLASAFQTTSKAVSAQLSLVEPARGTADSAESGSSMETLPAPSTTTSERVLDIGDASTSGRKSGTAEKARDAARSEAENGSSGRSSASAVAAAPQVCAAHEEDVHYENWCPSDDESSEADARVTFSDVASEAGSTSRGGGGGHNITAPAGSSAKGRTGGGSGGKEGVWMVISPAVSPLEVVQEVVGATEDATYKAAVILEYVRSCATVMLPLPPVAYCLLVELLHSNGQEHKLLMSIEQQIVEPSVEVAKELLRLGAPLARAGFGMLRRLGAHREYAAALLATHQPLAALRHIHRHQMQGVPQHTLLEAIAAAGNEQQLAAAARVLAEHSYESAQAATGGVTAAKLGGVHSAGHRAQNL